MVFLPLLWMAPRFSLSHFFLFSFPLAYSLAESEGKQKFSIICSRKDDKIVPQQASVQLSKKANKLRMWYAFQNRKKISYMHYTSTIVC